MRSTEATGLPTALIVDDDHVIRLLARETLTQYGFAVREAADGEEALERLLDRPPDLVLLDVDMPGMDGFEVCRRIRQRWDATDVPVIMVTGMDDLGSINEAYGVGANDFIAKPINWPILGYQARYVLRSAQSSRDLRDLEQKQAAVMRAMPDMILLLHRDGTCLDYKEGYGNTPFPLAGGFTGRSLAEILPAAVAAIILQGIERALEGGDLQSAVFELPLPDGFRHYEARIAPNGVDKVVAVVRDITAQKLSEEKIRHLAYYDTLTGMPNRQHFIERVDRDLTRARQDHLQLALLFIDLDGFKRINDTLGHDAGDYLLQSVADRLQQKLRAGDVVTRATPEESGLHFARLCGDEFTVVLPDIDDVEVAERIATRVLAALDRPFEIGGEVIKVTASIGIALFPDDGADANALLKHADTAMYHAKTQGRNNWQLYSKKLTAKAIARLKLENDLRLGLERNEFFLVYQPQVRAQDGRIIGIEALLRWRHPERGLVLPGDFIAVAEESGLIASIGEWVIRTACRQSQAWRQSGVTPPRIAVNVSTRQLRAPEFVDRVAAIFVETGVSGDLLEFELTESVLLDPDQQRIETLHRLRALGVRFAIDDFGTGYSSMTYVKRLPISILKIDQSFVQGLPDNVNDAGITTAVIAMARSLDLDVIAEGVETNEQCAFLQQAQCPILQGYLFSPPVLPEKMEHLLRQRYLPVVSPTVMVA